MQCVGKHAQTGANGRHFHAFVEQGLGLGEEFIGESATLPWWSRAEKRGGTLGAEFFASPLHGDKRHAESLGNLTLRRTVVSDELAGEEAERCDVFDRMGEYREVAIEVIYLPAALFESQFGSDSGAAGRE